MHWTRSFRLFSFFPNPTFIADLFIFCCRLPLCSGERLQKVIYKRLEKSSHPTKSGKAASRPRSGVDLGEVRGVLVAASG